jgi:hypothetical protein
VRQEGGKISMEQEFVQFDRAELRISLAPLRDEQNHLSELFVVRAGRVWCGAIAHVLPRFRYTVIVN